MKKDCIDFFNTPVSFAVGIFRILGSIIDEEKRMDGLVAHLLPSLFP